MLIPSIFSASGIQESSEIVQGLNLKLDREIWIEDKDKKENRLRAIIKM